MTVTSILVHDMHIDRATTLALAVPALMASAVSVDKFIGGMDHVHIERVAFQKTFRTMQPSVYPPRDDERRHINSKKASLGFGADQGYIWPSA